MLLGLVAVASATQYRYLTEEQVRSIRELVEDEGAEEGWWHRFKHHISHDIKKDVKKIGHDVKKDADKVKTDLKKFKKFVDHEFKDFEKTLKAVFGDLEKFIKSLKNTRSSNYKHLKIAAKDAGLVASGILAGVLEDFGYNQIKGCFENLEGIEDDVRELFVAMKDGHFGTALKDLSDIFYHAMMALKECNEAAHLVDEDIEKLRKFSESLETPVTFAIHVAEDVLFNLPEVYEYSHDAIEAFMDAKWFEAGEGVGSFIGVLLFG